MRNANREAATAPAAPAAPEATNNEPKMSFADEVRHRMAQRRMGIDPDEPVALGASPFFLFNKGDLILLVLIMAVIYVVVLVEHNLDLAHLAWIHFLKPNYDDSDL